jgi:hypothetical protein
MTAAHAQGMAKKKASAVCAAGAGQSRGSSGMSPGVRAKKAGENECWRTANNQLK